MMFNSISLRQLILVSGLLTVADVHGCHHDFVRRQRTDTWESAASLHDPAAECAPYSYAPVQAMVKSYPKIWEIADVSQPGIDPLAPTLYNQLLPSIPNIQVKGTPTGDFSASNTTYSRSDPDCWWTFSRCTTPKLPGLVHDVSTCPEPNTWGLSIDDGPNCSHNAYYDYLRQSNQKATLFYVGSNVIDWPLEAQRGLADGHEICAHTWSHRYMTGLTNEQVFAELYFSKKIIKDVLGVTVQCWRPPFGDVDDRVRFIANALGMSTILWDNDVNDFRYATLGQAAVNAKYQSIIEAASRGAFSTGGTIVLSHELNADTMTTNQNFMPNISQVFKYITPVAVCQNNSQPYVEKNFTYPTFAQWVSGTRVATLQPPVAMPNAPIALPLQVGVNSTAPLTSGYGNSTVKHKSAASINSQPVVMIGLLLTLTTVLSSKL
ncbi:hypothetical protein DFH28DRAFT_957846 [Melampsora americana]|nr:hypothetical protein DFH28DRAFT_957846 [Melampsora americana]